MKVFKYLQSIFDKRDVIVVEEEITPKPLLCEICGKESTCAVVTVHNPTGTAQDIKNCKQTVSLRCDEHNAITGEVL